MRLGENDKRGRLGLSNGRYGYYKYDANPPPNGIFASLQQLHDWVQFSSTASTGGNNNTQNDNNKQSLCGPAGSI